MVKDEIYNLIGLSERLQLPARWLKEQADAEIIPCLRIGRKRLFSLPAVKEALMRLAENGGAQ
jgi:hypothetical protein